MTATRGVSLIPLGAVRRRDDEDFRGKDSVVRRYDYDGDYGRAGTVCSLNSCRVTILGTEPIV